eukprot:1158916-Pelagomonas_calceolata.AAC.4
MFQLHGKRIGTPSSATYQPAFTAEAGSFHSRSRHGKQLTGFYYTSNYMISVCTDTLMPSMALYIWCCPNQNKVGPGWCRT